MVDIFDLPQLKLKDIGIMHNTAGKEKRFANFILDLVFLYIFSIVFGAIMGIFLAIVSPELLFLFNGDYKIVEYIFALIAGMTYYTLFEATTGRTIAKFITKTKVITTNGEKPDLNAILLRSLCRYIPFEAFSFLFADDAGWHDTLSKTIVIEVKK